MEEFLLPVEQKRDGKKDIKTTPKLQIIHRPTSLTTTPTTLTTRWNRTTRARMKKIEAL
jgi:hypothetical protein